MMVAKIIKLIQWAVGQQQWTADFLFLLFTFYFLLFTLNPLPGDCPLMNNPYIHSRITAFFYE
jgi:hypothetical protein